LKFSKESGPAARPLPQPAFQYITGHRHFKGSASRKPKKLPDGLDRGVFYVFFIFGDQRDPFEEGCRDNDSVRRIMMY